MFVSPHDPAMPQRRRACTTRAPSHRAARLRRPDRDAPLPTRPAPRAAGVRPPTAPPTPRSTRTTRVLGPCRSPRRSGRASPTRAPGPSSPSRSAGRPPTVPGCGTVAPGEPLREVLRRRPPLRHDHLVGRAVRVLHDTPPDALPATTRRPAMPPRRSPPPPARENTSWPCCPKSGPTTIVHRRRRRRRAWTHLPPRRPPSATATSSPTTCSPTSGTCGCSISTGAARRSGPRPGQARRRPALVVRRRRRPARAPCLGLPRRLRRVR